MKANFTLVTTGRFCVLLLCVFAIYGCASGGSAVRDQFVAESAITLSAAGDARVFARTDIRYSRSGRDYLYLGPVETNRQGLREYYLWVGTGSTLDRGYLAPEQSLPVELYMQVSGELMEFELRPWRQIATGPADEPLYRTPVAPDAEFAARVTLNQLELLAIATPETLSVRDSNGTTYVFYVWDHQHDWAEFVRLAGGHAEPIAAPGTPE